jgi:hypothetical protein
MWPFWIGTASNVVWSSRHLDGRACRCLRLWARRKASVQRSWLLSRHLPAAFHKETTKPGHSRIGRMGFPICGYLDCSRECQK